MRRLGWVFLLGALAFMAALFGWNRREREDRADRARKSGAI